MKLSEIISKDVINEDDGLKLGRVYDLELDIASGKILNVLVKDGYRLANILKTKNSIEIKWDRIIKIGNDVIIVDTANYKKE